MKRIGIVIGLLAFLMVGCRSKVTGNLEVDGERFPVKLCRSGEAYGYYGIELVSEGDRRLRLFGNSDGTCTAALFNRDAATGDNVRRCGTLTMAAQSSKINNITNVRGTALLSCETGQHRIYGRIEFENCH